MQAPTAGPIVVSTDDTYHSLARSIHITNRLLDRLGGSGGSDLSIGEKIPENLQQRVREMSTLSTCVEQNLIVIEQVLFGETIR